MGEVANSLEKFGGNIKNFLPLGVPENSHSAYIFVYVCAAVTATLISPHVWLRKNPIV